MIGLERMTVSEIGLIFDSENSYTKVGNMSPPPMDEAQCLQLSIPKGNGYTFKIKTLENGATLKKKEFAPLWSK